LEFGNGQLTINNDKTFGAVFDSPNTFFETQNKDVAEFIGFKGEGGRYTRLEFHQIFFDEQKPFS
jgi:hypothetical protein